MGYTLFAMTTALRVNNRVDETLGITVQLKIVSETTNFITQILVVLAYGGSCFCEDSD
jgi:hypothetical protein